MPFFWFKLVLSDQFYSCQFYVQTKCQTTNTVKVPVEVKSKAPYVQQQTWDNKKRIPNGPNLAVTKSCFPFSKNKTILRNPDFTLSIVNLRENATIIETFFTNSTFNCKNLKTMNQTCCLIWTIFESQIRIVTHVVMEVLMMEDQPLAWATALWSLPPLCCSQHTSLVKTRLHSLQISSACRYLWIKCLKEKTILIH